MVHSGNDNIQHMESKDPGESGIDIQQQNKNVSPIFLFKSTSKDEKRVDFI